MTAPQVHTEAKPVVRFYPPVPHHINIYQRRMQSLVESMGYEVQPIRMQSIHEEWRARDFIVVVNWPELRILNARGGLSIPRLLWVLCWERWLRWRPAVPRPW